MERKNQQNLEEMGYAVKGLVLVSMAWWALSVSQAWGPKRNHVFVVWLEQRGPHPLLMVLMALTLSIEVYDRDGSWAGERMRHSLHPIFLG
jgi:hypothetical protein